MKKFLTLTLTVVIALAMGLSMTSCGGSGNGSAYDNSIDTAFTKEVMETLSAFGDDPATGHRSAGSPAEKEAAEYLKGVMEDIGLSNVTVDKATVDGWTYEGANITFTNADGEEQIADLGGYATQIVAENEEIPVVYCGKGNAAEYEGKDVEGKLVLIEIDQNADWWITYPAYEAKVHGAKGVLAMTSLPTKSPERLAVQDICGPADAPALAISQKDCDALKAVIEASENKEATVVLNAKSNVIEDSQTQNVWGEIPGKSDQVIYLIGHYDGYFHSIYDNASGIATDLGIAKALIDSGYEPEKTIRVVAHGSEEWGKTNRLYDWGAGAYQQIVNIHPEWAENAFAVINIDGDFTIKGEPGYGISISRELYDFVQNSGKEVTDECGYEYTYYPQPGTGTEDFQWRACGIPSIVASSGEGETTYYSKMYHSSMDSYEGGELDEDALFVNHQVFGKILQDLDATAVRPMSFSTRLAALEESINTDMVDDEELMTLIGDAKTAAEALEAKMAEVEESGDADAIAEMNKNLFDVYKTTQDYFQKLDYNHAVVFPTERAQNNLYYINGVIDALEEGSVATAVDEYLWGVDLAWLEMYFSPETMEYLADMFYTTKEDTWGAGKLDFPPTEIGDVARSIISKYEEENPDLSAEIAEMKDLKAQQERYLAEAVDSEKEGLKEITKLMNNYSK